MDRFQPRELARQSGSGSEALGRAVAAAWCSVGSQGTWWGRCREGEMMFWEEEPLHLAKRAPNGAT